MDEEKPFNAYDKSLPLEQQTPEIPHPEKNPGMSDWIQMGEYILSNPQIRGLIIKYGSDIDEALDEYLGNYKGIVYQYVKGKYPDVYEALTDSPEPPRSRQDTSGREIDTQDEEEDYVPDKIILDEARGLAVSMHLAGNGWADISEQVFRKYDIDWHPMKVKDIVLKSLAWQQRPKQLIRDNKPQIPLHQVAQKVGLIRWLWSKLY